jgi:hypothetical protein
MDNLFQDYEAEIFDFNTGRHLTTLFTSTREEGEPFNIGDELILSDLTLYQNNSKRSRRCKISKLERLKDSEGNLSNKYNLYVNSGEEAVLTKVQKNNPSFSWEEYKKSGKLKINLN